MPCILDLDGQTVTSFWRPEENDNMIDGNAIFVHVYGSTEPIQVGLAYEDKIDMQLATLELTDQGGGAMAAAFKLDTLEHFLRGGFFCLQVNRVPPYPVSVWIDKAVTA